MNAAGVRTAPATLASIAVEAGRLARRTVQAWLEDSAGSMGAALAFYALFSMAPLVIIAIAITSAFFGRDEAQHLLLHQLRDVLGPNATAGIRFLVNATSDHSHVFPVALSAVAMVIGAATVFNELKTDLDKIWRVHANRPKGFIAMLRKRLLSIAMVGAVGCLLLASVLGSALISALGEKLFDGHVEAIRALEVASSIVVMGGLFALIYKGLPATEVAWGDVWVGSAATSALFWLGKFLIGIYLGRTALASMFGAAGAVLALVAWVYYCAMVFFLGAEFTRQYAIRHGSRRDDPDEPIDLERVAHPPPEEEILDHARRVLSGEHPLLRRGKK